MAWPENISPEESKVVEELKRRMSKELSPKLLEDESVLYRFCKARDFKLEDAETMLRKHIAWRKEWKVDTICEDYKPREVLKYAASSFVGFDKEGCLIRYYDFGRSDPKGFFKSIKMKELIKFGIQIVEQDNERLKQQSTKLGRTVTKFVIIGNFENFSLAQAIHGKAIEGFLLFMKTMQDNYPEKVKYIFNINTSAYYTKLMSIIKTVMAPALLQKLKVYGSEGWKEKLLKEMDAEVLPAFLGGKRTDPDGNPLCKTFIIHAQKVPEKYYLCNYEKKLKEAEEARKVTVARLSKEAVTFDVWKAGSCLEWEFQMEDWDKDIEFALYFKRDSPGDSESVEVVPKQRINTCYEPEKGYFLCQTEGTYTIVFDNSYSWLHAKELFYKVKVSDPNGTENSHNMYE
ncbi:retinal-binding protein [Caerostris darwini]|uniref:Retinal-binding protein n=1 Tax=Caerostris darwini TaxID=1538125 RepID=A0AAV4X651_9ARAC|nr:retinal-binding protein [Caerostris darwini]